MTNRNQIEVNSEIQINDNEFLTEEEMQTLLCKFNDTSYELTPGSNVVNAFESIVEKYPNKIAVVYEEKKLSYKELNEAVNRTACHLRNEYHDFTGSDITPDTLIPIYIDISLEMIIGILAILKSGGAYIPVVHDYPEDRIRYIFEDSNAKVVLSLNKFKDDLYKFSEKKIKLVTVDDYKVSLLNSENLNVDIYPDSLCYVLYTSGTTGKPKGVMQEHRSLINGVIWGIKDFGMTEVDNMSKYVSFGFDVSTAEIYPTLLSGATLHLIPEDMRMDLNRLNEYFENNHITISHLPTQIFEEFIELDNSSLTRVITAGEKLKKYRKTKYQINNGYGPTETYFATNFIVDKHYENIPIGKPIINYTCYVLDKNMKLCPIGISGELYIGGIGVARGYLNMPELTTEKFINNPFANDKDIALNKNLIIYKTGDLVRWLQNGNLEYLGRTDFQVKIRGFRIELGEIESKLIEISEVKETAVVALEDNHSNKFLCAYYVPKNEISEELIKDNLKKSLPDYMIPEFFVKLDRMPLTPNGKVNRKALPIPSIDSLRENYIAPETEKERDIAEVWQSVLQISQIGVKDNFFKLGGNSLKAIKAVSKLQSNYIIKVEDIFKTPSIEQLSKRIIMSDNTVESIKPVPSKKQYRASDSQRGMFIVDQMADLGTAYNIPMVIEIENELNYKQLNLAVNQLIERHEMLRSSFDIINNDVVQKVHKSFEYKIELFKISPKIADSEIISSIRPFDLTQNPLFRIKLFELSKNKHILFFDIHHIIFDGTSIDILVKDLFDLYDGIKLKPLKLQFKDYAEWELDYKKSKEYKEKEEFWLDKLKGNIPSLELPFDYSRKKEWDYSGENLSVILDKGIFDKLKEIADGNSTTLNSVFMAAYCILLHKYTGQEDMVIGTPVAGRERSEVQDMIGMFVNTMPFRTMVDSSVSFDKYLLSIKEEVLLLLSNQDYPFVELVGKLGVKPEIGRNPIYDVTFNYLTNYDSVKNVKVSVNEYGKAKFDLQLNIVETSQKLFIDFEYKTHLFKSDTIERLKDHYLNILKDISENPLISIKDIEIISEKEKNNLIFGFNSQYKDYFSDSLIHTEVEKQAELNPENIAVIYDSKKMTYKELNARSNQVARYIRKKHKDLTGEVLKRDTMIGVCLSRSLEMVVGLLGILKAGGAYVPIDSGYPRDRIEYILDDTDTSIVLTEQSMLDEIDYLEDESRNRIAVILTDNVEIRHFSKKNINFDNRPEDLAYIIYTSGTTGKPKGVMQLHRNVVRLFTCCEQDFGFNERDVWTMFHSFAFDFSIWEIWGALMYGGTLIVPTKDETRDTGAFYNLCVDNRVSVLSQTPSAFNVFMEEDSNHRTDALSLRYIVFGGEALNIQSLKKWWDRHPDDFPRLINMYGITETTVHVTFKPLGLNNLKDTSVSNIGKPLRDLTLYLLDENLKPVPIGLSGEMFVGGNGNARGYFKKPELTEERFIPNPFVTEDEKKMGRNLLLYKSGDLAKWIPNGDLEYLGRNDFQVKIRGFRIELGEIEAQLAKIEEISQCIVIDYDNRRQNSKQLIAYYKSDTELEIERIKSVISRELPEYMMPSFFIKMNEFPLTTNGKINRRALPEPDLESIALKKYVAPVTKVEKDVALAFQEILNIEKIGIEDDFFDLGGNSLSAVKISIKLGEMGYKTNIKDLFVYRNIRNLSETIKDKVEELLKFEHLPEQDYYELSGAQYRMYLTNKMSNLGFTYNIPIILEIKGKLRREDLGLVFDKLVERHKMLKTSFEMRNGVPVQIINDSIEYDKEFQKASLSQIDDLFQEFIKPFDFSKAPLFRIQLVSVSETQHFLFFDIHHILCDGLSVQIIIKEIFDLYNKKQLPDIEYSYTDYVAWQKKFHETENAVEQDNYWLDKLSGELPQLSLPIDHERKQEWDYNGNIIRFDFGEKLSQRINDFLRKQRVTQYTFLFSVFNILLGKISSQEDIIVGCVTGGRTIPEVLKMLGMFVSTLPVRTYPTGDKGFSNYLAEVNDEVLGMLSNQDCQFENIVDRLNIKREIGRNPIFDVIFNSININVGTGDQFKLRNTKSNLTAKFDLNLNVTENSGCYEGEFEYRSRLFEGKTIDRFIAYYLKILDTVLQASDTKIKDIDFIIPCEKQQLLHDFNDTFYDYPRESNVIEQFEKTVEQFPGNIAVVYENEKLTYSQLNIKINRMARTIRKEYSIVAGKELSSDTLIPICVDVGLNMIIGILAILKAGGAYVPLVHDYPEDRIKYILDDSDSRIILTVEKLSCKLSDIISEKVKQIYIDINCDEQVDETNIGVKISSHNLCYVLYTSGTTGKPKGVMIEHRSLLNGATWGIKDFDMVPDDNMSKYVSFGFDVSTAEIYPTLLSGATLHLIPENLRMDLQGLNRYFEDNNITISHLPTQIFEEFIEFENSSLTRVITAGEKLKKYRDRKYQINNGYGPTETYFCTNFVVNKTYSNIPIGKPIINDTCYVLDKYMNLCPIGVPGELYVGGDGVARGYFNKSDLTNEKFLENPFADEKDKAANRNLRIYKTGDLVRWLSDGNLEYLGRTDFQVKIRGFRIELGEVESKLLEIKHINEVAVLALDDETQNKYLCAYYVLKGDITEDDIKDDLRKSLPDYMIPEFFIKLDSMPLTANGKVNRKALPEPDTDSLKEEYIEPSTEAEITVSKVWQEVLKVDKIGIKDDFFKLGGNSLKVIRSVSQLQMKEYKVEIDDFFKFRTIEELAKNIKVQEKDFRSKLQDIKQKIISNMKPKYSESDLSAVKQEYDQKNKELLKKDISIAKTINNVLITGTTGYLGCYILKELLSNTDKFIYCIVRGENREIAKERQLEKIRYYFGDDFTEKIINRIKVFNGDLSKKMFSLSENNYKELTENVESIIHSAANVSHYGEYEVFYNSNVVPVLNLIEFAKIGTKKDLHYISTRGTVEIGDIPGKDYKIYTECDDIDTAQTAKSVYIRSKLEGEREVLKARKDGINTSIYRVGNLIFSSETKLHQQNIDDNAFYQVLKSFFNIGCVPSIIIEEEMSFIDYTAASICKLFDKKNLQNEIFHVYSPHRADLAKILTSPKLDVNLKAVNLDEFFDFIGNNYDKRAFNKYLEAMMLHMGWMDDDEEITQFTVLQDRTRLILEKLGFQWREAIASDFHGIIKDAYKDRKIFMSKMDIFNNIGEDLLYKIAGNAALKQIDSEKKLISEGRPNENVYFVMDGTLAESKKSIGGWEGVLRIIGKNSVLGLENITSDISATSSIGSIFTETEYLEIKTDVLIGFIMGDRQLFKNMQKVQMQEMDKLKRMIIALG